MIIYHLNVDVKLLEKYGTVIEAEDIPVDEESLDSKYFNPPKHAAVFIAQAHNLDQLAEVFQPIMYALMNIKIPTLLITNENLQLIKCNMLTVDNSPAEIAIEKFFSRPETPGKLIVIDGPDGVGKTTQVNALCERFPSAKTIKFPEKSGLYGNLIYECLFKKGTPVHSVCFATLCAANRYDNLSTLNWWLWKGETVILDRYSTTNIAYQLAYALQRGNCQPEFVIETFERIEYELFNLPKPTKVISLVLDVKTLLKNLSSKTRDNIEQKGEQFYNSLIDAYHLCYQNYDTWIEINCNRKSVDEITNEIVERVTLQ